MSGTRIALDALENSDLIVDAVYEGGRSGNAGDEPLVPLLGVSNQGGFRIIGSYELPKLMVIVTTMAEPDWPDFLDIETGLFTYYGDNRKPRSDLHGTPRSGNRMLQSLFTWAHGDSAQRMLVPPVLVFQRLRKAGNYRDVRFLGLAVPGAAGLPSTEDLVAIWRHAEGQRFQNYKAVFSILDVSSLSRAWLTDIHRGEAISNTAPAVWLKWIASGQPVPLRSTPNQERRTRDQQLPISVEDERILDAVYRHFDSRPHEFEACAAALAEMLLLPHIVHIDLTRLSRDGGRDAVGKYRIGSEVTSIEVEFALEAKCYAPGRSCVGVKDTSRLISRLRHRQFGILVTTSYIHQQAYGELLDDGHPVLLICGADIVAVLKKSGMRDVAAVEAWLVGRFTEPAVRNARPSPPKRSSNR